MRSHHPHARRQDRRLTIDVPRIETPRLVLREHRATDLDACAAMWAEAAVVRYITGKPSTRSETWARMARYRGFWPLLGYGYWAVEEKATGDFVGDLGFFDVFREIEPSIAGMPEAGWVLASRFHGFGFGTEALGAALAWADATLAHRRIAALVAPENARSLLLAKCVGFVASQTVSLGGQDTILLYRDARASATPDAVG